MESPTLPDVNSLPERGLLPIRTVAAGNIFLREKSLQLVAVLADTWE